ncbi:MAG: polyprenyl synthetase family protein [Candidatus Aenigmatarchaeota archaeon]
MTETISNEDYENLRNTILPKINLEIEKLLDKCKFPEVLKMVSAGKKKNRALSTVFSYGVFKEDIEKSLPAAAAVDVLTFSGNIIDDIVEKDKIRRGYETINSKQDEGYATLAAINSMLLALKYLSNNYKKELNATIYEHMLEATLSAVEGEFSLKMQIAKDEIDIENYLEGLKKINGKPYGFSTALGAIVAETSTQDIRKMYNYGFHKGVATQILGEIKNVYGIDEHETPISEAKNGRNLLWIYAKRVVDKENKKKLKKAIKNGDYNLFMKICNNSGVLDFVRKEGKKEVDAALASISDIKTNKYAHCLRKMAYDINQEIEK